MDYTAYSYLMLQQVRFRVVSRQEAPYRDGVLPGFVEDSYFLSHGDSFFVWFFVLAYAVPTYTGKRL
jgi:hypothetical protein